MYFIARKKEKKTDRQKERDLYGGREGERDEEIERDRGEGTLFNYFNFAVLG